MSNSLLTDSIIVKECLMSLKNNLGIGKLINRQYDAKFGQEGAKKGDTVNARKPARYTVTDGAALVIQDSQDESVPLTIDKQKHVGMAFSSKDYALSIDEFRERYIDPAILPLANQVEQDVYALYKKVPGWVGVPSATALPSDLKGFNQAKALMAHQGAPPGMYECAINPDVEASMVYGQKAYFNPSSEISKQYKQGVIGTAAGAEFFMSQLVPTHTAGNVDGTPLIDTTISSEGVATLHIDGVSTASIAVGYREGDVIQIDGVYDVNPVTKAVLPFLKRFVVTADTAVVSNEIAALPISPAIYLTGAKQNVSAYPVDGAAVTLFGAAITYAGVSAPQNLYFHKDAFTLMCVDMPLIKGAHSCVRASDAESGLSLRMWTDGDINNDRLVTRLDILYGVACLRPEYAVRVAGQPA